MKDFVLSLLARSSVKNIRIYFNEENAEKLQNILIDIGAKWAGRQSFEEMSLLKIAKIAEEKTPYICIKNRHSGFILSYGINICIDPSYYTFKSFMNQYRKAKMNG